MKKSQLVNIVKELLEQVPQLKADIRQDTKELAKDLMEKGILDEASVNYTERGALGKNKIIGVSEEYTTLEEMEQVIEKNYKKTGTSAFGSEVFTNGKVHFFFYITGKNTRGGVFNFLVRRKNYKAFK